MSDTACPVSECFVNFYGEKEDWAVSGNPTKRYRAQNSLEEEQQKKPGCLSTHTRANICQILSALLLCELYFLFSENILVKASCHIVIPKVFFFLLYVKISLQNYETHSSLWYACFFSDHVFLDIKQCIPMECVKSNYILSSPSITTSTKNTRRKIC